MSVGPKLKFKPILSFSPKTQSRTFQADPPKQGSFFLNVFAFQISMTIVLLFELCSSLRQENFPPSSKCKISFVGGMWKKRSKLAHCSFAFPSFQHISFGNQQSINCIIVKVNFFSCCSQRFYFARAKHGLSRFATIPVTRVFSWGDRNECHTWSTTAT